MVVLHSYLIKKGSFRLMKLVLGCSYEFWCGYAKFTIAVSGKCRQGGQNTMKCQWVLMIQWVLGTVKSFFNAGGSDSAQNVQQWCPFGSSEQVLVIQWYLSLTSLDSLRQWVGWGVLVCVGDGEVVGLWGMEGYALWVGLSGALGVGSTVGSGCSLRNL